MDINKAYHIAGVIVATHHAHFHRLEGRLPLNAINGLESVIKPDPKRLPAASSVTTPNGGDSRVEDERLMLLLAGRQAELIHFTLNAPTQLDFHMADLNLALPAEIKADPTRLRQRVTEALSVVTRNWHQIECLAAWLTRQDREVLPTSDLIREISAIRPDDHGLFP